MSETIFIYSYNEGQTTLNLTLNVVNHTVEVYLSDPYTGISVDIPPAEAHAIAHALSRVPLAQLESPPAAPEASIAGVLKQHDQRIAKLETIVSQTSRIATENRDRISNIQNIQEAIREVYREA